MRKSKLIIGTLSSLVWPALVLVVPMGITFAAARVYAESSTGPLACREPGFTLCNGSVEGQSCGPCAVAACACFMNAC